jgi:hypothetical protein
LGGCSLEEVCVCVCEIWWVLGKGDNVRLRVPTGILDQGTGQGKEREEEKVHRNVMIKEDGDERTFKRFVCIDKKTDQWYVVGSLPLRKDGKTVYLETPTLRSTPQNSISP